MPKRRKSSLRVVPAQETKKFSRCEHCHTLIHQDSQGWWLDKYGEPDCLVEPVNGFHEKTRHTYTLHTFTDSGKPETEHQSSPTFPF